MSKWKKNSISQWCIAKEYFDLSLAVLGLLLQLKEKCLENNGIFVYPSIKGNLLPCLSYVGWGGLI